MKGREKKEEMRVKDRCKISLEPMQRIFYYSDSIQGKPLCYCMTPFSGILHFCAHGLEHETPWNKFYNVLLQEKYNQ